LVYYQAMIKLNIHEAKVQFSRCIAEVEAGETIVVCRRNEPVAEIRPLPPTPREPRPFGLLAGQFEVPDSFFEPLPDEVLAELEGREAK
jgi:antitoxin (DNA-binding transcriptional repressor) of toxin-antitoxin stability system